MGAENGQDTARLRRDFDDIAFGVLHYLDKDRGSPGPSVLVNWISRKMWGMEVLELVSMQERTTVE
jgi:hypothetical protein